MVDDTDGKLPLFVKNRIDRLLTDFAPAMTYADLADAMEMDRGQLSKVLNRRQMVRLDTLQRIAKALDVPLASLFQSESDSDIRDLKDFANMMGKHYQEEVRALTNLAGAEELGALRAAAGRVHLRRGPFRIRT